jgi:YggT family protein
MYCTANPFIWLLFTILDIYLWVIIIWVVSSWLIAFNIINPHNQIVRTILLTLARLVEPVMRPIRRVLPDLGGLDLSPMVAILGIIFLQRFICWAYVNYL